jgi:hypothetical protein
MQPVQTILGEYGYYYTGSCRCDGHYTEKFRRAGTTVVIRWRVHKQLFKVSKDNSTHKSWQNIGKLQATLDELATENI